MTDIIQLGPQSESGLKKLATDIKSLSKTKPKQLKQKKSISALIVLTLSAVFITAIIYSGWLLMTDYQSLMGKLPILIGVIIATGFGVNLFSE